MLRHSITNQLPSWPGQDDTTTMYAWGVDGKYYKVEPEHDFVGTGKRWILSRVILSYSLRVYTGDNNDGPCGYRDHDTLSKEEFKSWSRGLNLTRTQDPSIEGHQWEGLLSIFSTLLEGGSIHPEMMDKL